MATFFSCRQESKDAKPVRPSLASQGSMLGGEEESEEEEEEEESTWEKERKLEKVSFTSKILICTFLCHIFLSHNLHESSHNLIFTRLRIIYVLA